MTLMHTCRTWPREAPPQQRLGPGLPPAVAAGTGFSYRDLDGSTLPPGPGPGPAGKHRHPAGLDRRVDCPVRKRAHPGHRAGRRGPPAVHLPPGNGGNGRTGSSSTAPSSSPNRCRPPGGGSPWTCAAKGSPANASWPAPSGCWTADPCGWGPSGTPTRTAATAWPPCCAPTSRCARTGSWLSFPAKSGKDWESEIRDADLAALVRLLKRRGGNARLLAYKDGRSWRPVTSADINAYVKERTGSDFTAKDFRTLRGTVAAAASLARTGPQQTVAERKRAISRAMQDAAEVLGNTPSIARKSYVDPRRAGPLPRRRNHRPPADRAPPKSELRALLYREGDVVSRWRKAAERLEWGAVAPLNLCALPRSHAS